MLSHIRSLRSRWVNDASKAKSFSFGWFKARKQHFATNASSQFLVISPEVEEAIKSGNPVVSLESTIVAHGMPVSDTNEIHILKQVLLLPYVSSHHEDFIK